MKWSETEKDGQRGGGGGGAGADGRETESEGGGREDGKVTRDIRSFSHCQS